MTDLLEVNNKYKQGITNKVIKVEATKPKSIALAKEKLWNCSIPGGLHPKSDSQFLNN